MRFFTTIALAAATASAVHLQQEESTAHSSSPAPTLFDDIDAAIYDENGKYRGDVDGDSHLTREEYDASGIREVLRASFDRLNINTEDNGGEETVDG